jgi:hypothetical protein
LKKNSIRKGIMLTLASLGMYGLVAATNLPKLSAEELKTPSPAISGLESKIEQNYMQPFHWSHYPTDKRPTIAAGVVFGYPEMIGAKIIGNWDKPLGWQFSGSCYPISAVLRGEARFNNKHPGLNTYAFFGGLSFFDFVNGYWYPYFDAGVGCEIGKDKGFALGVEAGLAFSSNPFGRDCSLFNINVTYRY